MNFTITWQYYETNQSSKQQQLLLDISEAFNDMVHQIEVWANDPSSVEGGIALGQAVDWADRIHAMFEELDSNPYHELDRMEEDVSFFRHMYWEIRRGDGYDNDIETGRQIQRSLDTLRMIRDEWQQIADYVRSEGA